MPALTLATSAVTEAKLELNFMRGLGSGALQNTAPVQPTMMSLPIVGMLASVASTPSPAYSARLVTNEGQVKSTESCERERPIRRNVFSQKESTHRTVGRDADARPRNVDRARIERSSQERKERCAAADLRHSELGRHEGEKIRSHLDKLDVQRDAILLAETSGSFLGSIDLAARQMTV